MFLIMVSQYKALFCTYFWQQFNFIYRGIWLLDSVSGTEFLFGQIESQISMDLNVKKHLYGLM